MNTYDETLGLNFLLTYRVNSGTAFYVGYDDHYRQRAQFEDQVNITGTGYQQTNRAIFTKFQYSVQVLALNLRLQASGFRLQALGSG